MEVVEKVVQLDSVSPASLRTWSKLSWRWDFKSSRMPWKVLYPLLADPPDLHEVVLSEQPVNSQ